MKKLKSKQKIFFNVSDSVLFNVFADSSFINENQTNNKFTLSNGSKTFEKKLIEIGVNKYSLDLFQKVLKIEEKLNEEYAIKYLEGYFEYIAIYNK